MTKSTLIFYSLIVFANCSTAQHFKTIPGDWFSGCLAEGAYTKVIFSDKRKLLISKSLGDIEEMLPADIFIRIHHSTVVNINAVTHYVRTDGGYVILNNNEKLMVSKGKKEKLMQRLGLKA